MVVSRRRRRGDVRAHCDPRVSSRSGFPARASRWPSSARAVRPRSSRAPRARASPPGARRPPAPLGPRLAPRARVGSRPTRRRLSWRRPRRPPAIQRRTRRPATRSTTRSRRSSRRCTPRPGSASSGASSRRMWAQTRRRLPNPRARGARRRGVVFDEHRRRRAKEARHRRTCVRGSDDRDRDCASRDASARVCSRVDRAPALLRGGFPRLGKNRVVKHRASRRLGRRRHRLARNRGQNVGGEDPRTGQYLQSELQRRGRGAHRAVLRVAARKLTRREKTLLCKKKKKKSARALRAK